MKQPTYSYLTTSNPCELCGSTSFTEKGHIQHQSHCVRPTPTDTSVLYKYGFQLGQIVVANSDVVFESHRDKNGNWVNDPVPSGSLLEIIGIAPKIQIASAIRIGQHPNRFDNRDHFYIAILADGSNQTKIRADFVTIRRLTLRELSIFRDGYNKRMELTLRINNKLMPLIAKLQAQDLLNPSDRNFHVAGAKVMFGTDNPTQEQIDFAKRASMMICYGAGPAKIGELL